MEFKSHITATLAIGAPLIVASGEMSLINLGALAAGSLLPDIDHPDSYFGRRHKVISNVTTKTLGHRGATHSLLGLAACYLLFLVVQKFYLSAELRWLPFWLAVGYLAHLIEDSFSARGIQWLWPLKISKKTKKFFFYNTGGISEYLLLEFFLCLLVMEIYLYASGKYTNVISPESMFKLEQAIRTFQTVIYF